MTRFATIIFISLIPFCLLACNTGESAASEDQASATGTVEEEPQQDETGKTASVQLDLDGMTCVNCAAAIEEAFDEADGVVEGSVDFGDRRADVDYDPDVLDEAGVVAIVEEAGFDAELIDGASDE